MTRLGHTFLPLDSSLPSSPFPTTRQCLLAIFGRILQTPLRLLIRGVRNLFCLCYIRKGRGIYTAKCARRSREWGGGGENHAFGTRNGKEIVSGQCRGIRLAHVEGEQMLRHHLSNIFDRPPPEISLQFHKQASVNCVCF